MGGPTPLLLLALLSPCLGCSTRSSSSTVTSPSTSSPSTSSPSISNPSTTSPSASSSSSSGVVVVGGSDGSPRLLPTSVFPPSSCSLPPLARTGHTLSRVEGGLVVCGGQDEAYTTLSSCLSWSPGSSTWSSSYTMREARAGHLAWTPPTRPGTLLLLGGEGAETAGEEVPGGAAFTLPHVIYASCGMEDGDTFIVTGGGSSYVTRFGPTGAMVEELPRLPEARLARHSHGCGHYPTGEGQALLVAGGWITSFTSSVLTLLPSATSWSPLSPLPRRLHGPASSMVGGRLWLVGGSDDKYFSRAEVLQYEPSTDTWTALGNITGRRSDHGMVAVGPHHLPCLSGYTSN